MENSIKCHYCFQIIDNDDFLSCEKCGGNVHTKCLKRPGTPGDLHGDVFFIFTCSACTPNGRELFIRQKLPWLMIIALTIYNLSIQSKGLSHHGYFHWRTNITSFIDKNWDYLFPPSMRRKKKWVGTVSGILSHNSPDLFMSGNSATQESGWWKLTYNQTPKFYMKLYEQLSVTRQQLRNDKRKYEENNYFPDFSSSIINDDQKRRKVDVPEEVPCSRTLPYMGRPPKNLKNKIQDDIAPKHNIEMSSVQSSLKEFLEENLVPNDLLFSDIPPAIETEKVFSLIDSNENDDSMYDLWNSELPELDYKEDQYEDRKVIDRNTISCGKTIPLNDNRKQQQGYGDDNDENDDNNFCSARIIQVTNFQQLIKEEPKTDDSENGDDDDGGGGGGGGDDGNDDGDGHDAGGDDGNNQDNEFIYEKSLFTKHPKRELPWEEEEDEVEEGDGKEDFNSLYNNVQLMSEYEEKLLYNQLGKIFNSENQIDLKIPPSIRRFYRKLHIRNYKRNNLKPVFNLDTFGEKRSMNNQRTNILDRYHNSNAYLFSINKYDSIYHARISGPVQYEFFESPYTSRILHPFIYRHSKLFPPWLKVMCELQYVVTGNRPSRSTIDFCYVRPNHIPAVNALLQCLFWPGIDMSECLSYPDFTVVALYKKLVIGCAFLVPDVGHNEAYISFMAVRPGWQKNKIASFMLYHLTQTCMGKDITLHVSATNSAICLYQKFGFKIKEVVLDFYEKYLPLENKNSRHALFLRLSR